PTGGEQRWLEVVASVIPYLGTPSILFHALDVSTRKYMEIERESMRQKIARGEQMEALGTLAGGVAHDLNNILGGVVSYPELLLQGMDEENKLYSPLKTIHQSGLKAAAIVQDLLTLTRRGVVITEVVNLGNIIREYLASPEFDHLCKEFQGIFVALQIDDRLMNIKGSYHHLSKSIMNLVTNSAEALPQGGDILITAQNLYVDSPFGSYDEINEGEYVAVSISDNGEGISAEDLDKIFEPFYTKKIMGRSGTGLGMSVVWGTVKDHQGFIDIDSKKGEGSTFTLYFPASRQDLSESVAALTAQAPRGRGEKLLVVDDIEEQRLIAATMLEHLGYDVDAAESGEQALEILKDNRYVVILLDMIMEPGMDGLDTFQEILRIYPQQKAVIASGFSETERVRSALAMGAGAYIKKPYGLEALATTINEVICRENKAN
ncbi:MAG: response regulator, partial [Bacteroidetes bacterium]|nr:response regulator [Bacteroidota bacterium]